MNSIPVIEVLEGIAEIAHWTIVPHSGASGEELSCPPLIAWRYAQPSDELAEFFRQALDSFRGSIRWEFYTLGPRWVLMPRRLKEYSDSHGDIGYTSAALELKAADPGFGLRANEDLSLLAIHIRQCQLMRNTEKVS